MPLPNFSDSIEKNIIRHIKYRGTIRTGEITADNGDETYDVKIAMSDQAYPDVETLYPNDVFQVGEIVTLAFEYGSKEIPKIIGHGKKVAQDPVDVIVDYSGTARVETLNAYTVTSTSAYLEGRIELGGAGNCTTRGFQYGTTTAYEIGSPHDDGSYGSGSYNKKITGLTHNITYHFRAYIIDENDDTIYGNDKTFTTVSYSLVSGDVDTDKIYIHIGVTSAVSSSWAENDVYGLAYDGTDLIATSSYNSDIFVHSGVTSAIKSSFKAPAAGIRGATFDGTNLITACDDDNKIYIHSGVSSGTSSSFNSPSSRPRGLTYDGSNLISDDLNADKIYIHSGITSSISSNFASPALEPYGLACDGTNLFSLCFEDSEGTIYIHSGITSTISSSFPSPDGGAGGLTLIIN